MTLNYPARWGPRWIAAQAAGLFMSHVPGGVWAVLPEPVRRRIADVWMGQFPSVMRLRRQQRLAARR